MLNNCIWNNEITKKCNKNVTNEIKHIEHYSGNGNSQTPTPDTFWLILHKMI